MISPRVSAVARGITAASGLAVVLISAAVAGEIRSATGHNSTYGDVSAWFALLEILVGVGLLGAALILLSERSTAMLGVLALATAAAWFAPVWVGWQGGPEPLRGVGLVTAPLLPAAVLAVISGVPPRITSAGRIVLLVLVAAGIPAMFAASIALTVVRDPIRDPYCWSDCTASAFVVHDDPGLARRLVSLVLLLGAATGGLAAAAGAIRFARAASVTRRGSGPALAAASLAGITLAAYAISLHYVPHEVPSRPLYAGLFVARALALLALAFGLAWLALRPRIVRGLVTRLVVDLERSAAEGGLGRLLARALGDPQLRLGYPLGSATERIVDAEGHPLTFHPARHVTPIVGDEGVVALVESDATTADALGRELGPAVHLALGNERLRAEALARLADVTESRARIVETADAARLRMERDLHDGAQQRMLALTYDLRVALTAAEAAGNEPAAVPLRTALDRAAAASGELREIAHGVYPAELKASGLEAALQSLADLHALRLVLRLPAGRRYSSEIEAAAYAVVAEALEAAEGPVVATVSESDGRLRLEVEGVGVWGDHLVYVEDRIGAAGGEVTAEQQRLDVSLPGSPA